MCPDPASTNFTGPPKNFDPGRIRAERLFRALYGDCLKGGVAKRMRQIAWVPKHGGGSIGRIEASGYAYQGKFV